MNNDGNKELPPQNPKPTLGERFKGLFVFPNKKSEAVTTPVMQPEAQIPTSPVTPEAAAIFAAEKYPGAHPQPPEVTPSTPPLTDLNKPEITETKTPPVDSNMDNLKTEPTPASQASNTTPEEGINVGLPPLNQESQPAAATQPEIINNPTAEIMSSDNNQTPQANETTPTTTPTETQPEVQQSIGTEETSGIQPIQWPTEESPTSTPQETVAVNPIPVTPEAVTQTVEQQTQTTTEETTQPIQPEQQVTSPPTTETTV